MADETAQPRKMSGRRRGRPRQRPEAGPLDVYRASVYLPRRSEGTVREVEEALRRATASNVSLPLGTAMSTALEALAELTRRPDFADRVRAALARFRGLDPVSASRAALQQVALEVVREAPHGPGSEGRAPT